MKPWEKYKTSGKPWEKYKQGPSRKLEPWQQEQMLHPPRQWSQAEQIQMGLAQQAGVPIADVSLSQGNAGPGARFSAGYLTDTPAEQRAFLEKQYPGGQIFEQQGTFGVIPQGGGPMQVPNPPGFEWLGSPAEFAGRVGPGVLGGSLGTLAGAPAGPLGAFGGAVAGVTAAEGGRELAQKLAGTQRESPWEFGGRVALDASLEGIPLLGRATKALGRGAKSLATKRGLPEFSKFVGGLDADGLEGMMKVLKDEYDLSLPALKVMQRSDDPTIKRFADQFLQFSKEGQGRLAEQMDEFATIAKHAGPEAPMGQSADSIIQGAEAGRFAARTRQLAGDQVDPEAAGQAFQGIVDTARSGRKQAMQQEYGKLDSLVEEYSPRYDLSGAQAAAQRRQVEGILPTPEGADSYSGGVGWVNVAAPNEKLARINHVLSKIDPQQDYQVLKELRTQTGQMLQMDRAKLSESNVDIGQIKQVYNDLNRALEKPIGVPPEAAQELVSQGQNATKSAKFYHDTFDLPEVRQALRTQETGADAVLFNQLVSDPAKFSGRLRQVISEGTQDQQRQLSQALQNSILQSEDPLSALRTWQKQPKVYGWLFPDSKARETALRNAKELAALNTSAARKAENAAFEQVGFAQVAIKDHMGQRYVAGSDGMRQAQEMVKLYGGRGSEGHLALRRAVYADTMDPALGFHKDTRNLVLNPGKLRDRMAKLEESGLWYGVLTKEDRTKMETLYEYAKRTFRKGDAGTGLTVAAQVGQMRHGNPAAAVSYLTALRFANMLTETSLPAEKYLFSAIGGRAGVFSDSKATRVLGALLRSYGQGTAAQDIMEGGQSGRRGQATLPPQLNSMPLSTEAGLRTPL